MPRASRHRDRSESDSETIETQSITTTSTSISSQTSEFANILYELIAYLDGDTADVIDDEMYHTIVETLKECYTRIYDEEYGEEESDSDE